MIEKENVNPSLILCLSFTNETVNNLKEKINYNIDILTFHKLALSILKDNNFKYFISPDSLLDYLIDEYFQSYLVNKKLLDEYLNNGNNLEYLKQNILSLIKKIKCNNINIKEIKKVIKKLHNDNDKILFIFTLNIYKIYTEELLSTLKIDFDDMIIYAKKVLKKSKDKLRYRYIIIDEYQDISLIRFNLIKEILNKTNASLMCVGDDYQSIYGFSGSNINLFTCFFKYFPNAKRIDIKNTYRNCYQLIKTSLKFIRKNPYQLRKNIHAKFLLK